MKSILSLSTAVAMLAGTAGLAQAQNVGDVTVGAGLSTLGATVEGT